MDNNQNKKNNKNNPNNNRQGLGIVLITTLLVVFVLIGFFSAMGNTSQREISYDKFLKLVSEHKVKEVKLDSEKIYITLTDKAREEAREKAVEKAEKEGRLSPFEEAMERLRIQLPSVKKEGKEINLTKKEYDTLLLFARNPGNVLFREIIYERVWGGDYIAGSRTVDLHVQRVRKKVGWEDFLITVPKMGYRLEVPR